MPTGEGGEEVSRESHRAAAVGLVVALLGVGFLNGADLARSASVLNSVPLPAGPSDIHPSSGYIVENVGQIRDERIRFYISSGGILAGFEDSALLLRLLEPRPSPSIGEPRLAPPIHDEADSKVRGVLIRIEFEGANRVQPHGRGELPHRTHYFLGKDPDAWRTNVRSYAEVVYENLFDGIDLVYRPTGQGVKYEFVVGPGADPAKIAISYKGIRGLAVDGPDLVVATDLGDLRDSGLRALQGGRDVPCAFVLRSSRSHGFRCGAWETSRTLIIDPLIYATFLGGAGDDYAVSVAVDSAGSAYAVGYTLSTDFPFTPGSFETTHGGNWDGFVLKLQPSGSGLVYGAFLGGGLQDYGYSIAVDSVGNAYVAGATWSADFPTIPGAYDISYNGLGDAFVAKVSSAGSDLVYATFLGGQGGQDDGRGIAIDSTGNAYVTGLASAGFPTTLGAFNSSYGGNADAFAAKLDSTGSGLVYSTFLGGTFADFGNSIATSATGEAYVAGYTTSANFPTTPGALDRSYSAAEDGFVAKLNDAGTNLIYATYLGRGSSDYATSIATDSAGNAYVAALTRSFDFGATPGAFDTSHNGNYDAFVAKLNPTGSQFVWGTFLGGAGDDHAYSVRVDSAGHAYVTGLTYSPEFPTTSGAFDTSFNGVPGTNDAFAARLDDQGRVLVYSTFLGGSAYDGGYGIAVGATGYAYVAGVTTSANFPATPGAFDPSYNGNVDAFVAKLDMTAYPITVQTSPSGLQVSVDGLDYISPYTFWCLAGSSHLLDTPSPQVVGSTRYSFSSWSDGGGKPRTVPCTASGTYTADFETEYRITVATSPTGLQVEVDGRPFAAPYVFWCPPGSSHGLSAPSPQVVGSTRHFFASWSDGGSRSHPVTCTGPVAYTVTFATEHNTTVATSPSGLQVLLDGDSFVAPYSFWCSAGSFHTLETVPSQELGMTRYAFDSWSDGDALRHAITCNPPPSTFTANFLTTAFEVTITTLPPDLVVIVNGTAITAPYSFWCAVGSTHTLDVVSPQIVGSTRFMFTSWSDGGAQAHTFRCDAPATYVASFSTDFQVTVDTSPVGLEVQIDGTPRATPYSFWCSSGVGHFLDATSPQGSGPTRFLFTSWSDGGSMSHSIVCGGSATYIAYFGRGHQVTVATGPADLIVRIDGTASTTPQTFFWLEGSSHTLDAPSPQGTGFSRYVFSSWSDGGGRDHTVTITAPEAYSATFGIEHLVTITTSPDGLQVIVNGTTLSAPLSVWWLAGSSHTVDAPSPQTLGGTTYEFAAWSDGGAQDHAVTIVAPTILVAIFVPRTKDFSLFASPSQQTAVPGGSAAFTVSVVALNGYDGPAVAISVANPPSGFSATCAPTSLNPPGSCTLIVNVDASVGPASYLLSIEGSNGTALRYTAISITVTAPDVPDFQLQVSPVSIDVEPGRDGTLTVTITPLNGFSGQVVLSVGGLPAAVGARFSPPVVAASGSSTVTLIVGTSATPGTYTVAVTGTSGGLARSASIEMEILSPTGGLALPPPAWDWLLVGAGVGAAIAFVGVWLWRRRRPPTETRFDPGREANPPAGK